MPLYLPLHLLVASNIYILHIYIYIINLVLEDVIYTKVMVYFYTYTFLGLFCFVLLCRLLRHTHTTPPPPSTRLSNQLFMNCRLSFPGTSLRSLNACLGLTFTLSLSWLCSKSVSPSPLVPSVLFQPEDWAGASEGRERAGTLSQHRREAYS